MPTRLCLVALAVLAVARQAAADDAVVSEPSTIGLPGGSGVIRGRTQVMYDPAVRGLVRRWVQVWDARPDRNRTFTWTPERLPSAGAPAEGKGQLTWRDEGAPSYDPDAVVNDYRGTLRNGRPDGSGTEIDRDGISYAGQWRDGRPEGQGRLRLGDGAEYDGAFHLGMAEGRGRFVDIDGEVFEGGFRKGLREGFATTILPNRARYQSRWHAGLEDTASRRVRLAQAGGGTAALDQDIRIGVSIVERPAKASPLQYTSANSGEVLKVFPDNERLMSVWKGDGELQTDETVDLTRRFTGYNEGIFDIDKTGISPLQFTVNVQNKSGKPLQIVGAFVQVEASSTDYQPAIQISIPNGSACGSEILFSPRFDLQNLGWGPVENPVIRYAFQAAGVSQLFEPKQTKVLDKFVQVRSVDFESDLRAAGMDVGVLKQYAASQTHLTCKASSTAECLDELKRTGFFGRLANDVFIVDNVKVMIALKGLLDYDWRDSFGSYQHRESPFTSKFLLGMFPETSECGEGGEDIPIAVNPVELQLDRANYRLPLTFERTVAPGRTSRYSFVLSAAKASRHRFKVVIQLADGREITSRPVDLTYFLPNWKPSG